MLNVLSTAGASILAVGLGAAGDLPDVFDLLRRGRDRPNPWGAKGLEWETASPPPTENFPVTPIVTTPAYAYTREEIHVV